MDVVHKLEGTAQVGFLVTRALTEFALASTYSALPREVREFVKLGILDQVGVQAYGSTLTVPRLVREYVVASSAGACTIVGSSKTASAEGTAFANGVSGHGFELDDVHLPSFNHPGAAVVPAGLAVGELVGANGQQLISAVAMGYEVMCRVGRGLSPSYVQDRGFHPQGVVGPLGAAVTAGLLLGLGARELEHAMSLSVSHAGGTLQYLETPSDSPQLHAGLGAMGGVRSALLAAAGFRGPGEIIEGRYGLARAYADTSDFSLMTGDLGSVYSLMYNTFKVRPYHALVHAAIDTTVEALVTGADVAVGDIERIVLGGTSRLKRFVGGKSLQLSVELAVAQAIVHGGGLDGLLEFGEDDALDEVTIDLARRIVITQDEECEREFDGDGHRGPKVRIKVEIALRDGSTFRAENYAKGSYENQFSATELRDKYDALMHRSPIGMRSAAVASMILDCDGLERVSDITLQLRDDDTH